MPIRKAKSDTKKTNQPATGGGTHKSEIGSVQFKGNSPESLAQQKFQKMANIFTTSQSHPIQKKPNKTGMPDQLKSGIENLSGHSMDDVKVHYNSSKPTQLNAHAFAQGSNIHLASGQEKHLPHEAWHVVQQKQGRVQPTMQMKGKIPINDDADLEKEADIMGEKALQLKVQKLHGSSLLQPKPQNIGMSIHQRLSVKVKSLVFKVESVFKRAKSLLITSVAENVEDKKIRGYQDIIAHAEAELKKYIEEDNIKEDNAPNLNPMVDKEPIYISNEVIYVRSEFFEMGDDAKQTRMLFDLLTQDKVVDLTLFKFIDEKSDHEFEDQEEMTLTAGVSLYRVLNAASAYKYIANGIGRVGNKEGWTELGNGFYTSPDFQGAEAYAPTVGRPAAVIEMKLDDDAKGKVFTNTGDLDGKTEQSIENKYGKLDFVTDRDVSQIKFQNPFYRQNLTIFRVFVLESANKWRTYTNQEFVDSYRKHIIDRHKEEADEVNPDPKRKDIPMSVEDLEEPSFALRNAPDASANVMEAISYSEAAIKFEEKLGNYLATYGPALNQISKLAQAAWKTVSDKDKHKFGTTQAVNTGMVGNDLISLKAVVEGGNLREKFTFLYNGYQKNIFGKLERPKIFAKERKTRELRPKEDSASVRKPHPKELGLPLSDREWFGAVDGKGKLGWEPGAAKYHYKMNSKFQADAELLLAPVATGTSGTAYGILQMAEKLSTKTNVNFELVRLGLLGWMIPARDHTFHEIMTACEIFSKDLAYDPELYRYQNIPPLSTSFLRANIAIDNLFPDEIEPEKAAFSKLIQSALLKLQNKTKEALTLHNQAEKILPKKLWTKRMTNVQRLSNEIVRYQQMENKIVKGNIYRQIQNDFDGMGISI